MTKVYQWLFKNAVVTLLLLVWGILLATWVTYQMFTDISAITGSSVTAYGILFALPTTVIGLWKWRNGGDK